MVLVDRRIDHAESDPSAAGGAQDRPATDCARRALTLGRRRPEHGIDIGENARESLSEQAEGVAGIAAGGRSQPDHREFERVQANLLDGHEAELARVRNEPRIGPRIGNRRENFARLEVFRGRRVRGGGRTAERGGGEDHGCEGEHRPEACREGAPPWGGSRPGRAVKTSS